MEAALLYNTYVKMYLTQKGKALRQHLSKWAREQPRLVLWIQREPPKLVDFVDTVAPAFGWLVWTADLWQNGQHRQWHLAWVHPHGQQVHWLPGLAAWDRYWNARG